MSGPLHMEHLLLQCHIPGCQCLHSQMSTSAHAKPTNLQQYFYIVSTPYPPNARSLIPLPLGGRASVAILMTPTLTPPSSPKFSPPFGIQSPFFRNSYPRPSITQTLTASMAPVTFLLPLFIIQASTILNTSLWEVSTFSPQTSSLNLPQSLSTNPPISLLTPVSIPIILPPHTSSQPYNRPQCKTCPIHHLLFNLN